MKFPESFVLLLEEAAGKADAAAVLEGLSRECGVSVRLNPFKPAAPTFLESSSPVPWSSFGRILASRPSFTLEPFFHAGAFYVQESSAMFVGEMFRHVLPELPAGRPLRVLDLCAAPGGKTTDLAASLRMKCGDRFILVANEVMKQRAAVLADNVARWGDPNVVVTSLDPKCFEALEGWFDLIVADVPCSGEGMFRKDASALEQWSPDNVKLCASRQRRIIADVWPALAEGGILVYSTCTFNRLENDGNAEWIAAELGADHTGMDLEPGEGPRRTEHGFSLFPGLVPGEGQYCAALRKVGGIFRGGSQTRFRTVPGLAAESWFNKDMVFAMRGGDTLVALPAVIADEAAFLFSKLRTLASGVTVGTVKGRDLVPDEDLALCMALWDGAFPKVELDRERALHFLHKDALAFPDSPKGFLQLTHGGVSLGFVKNLGNRSNSLHPNGRRILMDIK
ncbi:MAG: rRNA cytosine-C5-methyltransferase [Bacteroidales bacterium]|nr:rRNA cytosine-C5-methyltransferase [Bacteroidales bacterium]